MFILVIFVLSCETLKSIIALLYFILSSLYITIKKKQLTDSVLLIRSVASDWREPLDAQDAASDSCQISQLCKLVHHWRGLCLDSGWRRALRLDPPPLGAANLTDGREVWILKWITFSNTMMRPFYFTLFCLEALVTVLKRLSQCLKHWCDLYLYLFYWWNIELWPGFCTQHTQSSHKEPAHSE